MLPSLVGVFYTALSQQSDHYYHSFVFNIDCQAQKAADGLYNVVFMIMMSVAR